MSEYNIYATAQNEYPVKEEINGGTGGNNESEKQRQVRKQTAVRFDLFLKCLYKQTVLHTVSRVFARCVRTIIQLS